MQNERPLRFYITEEELLTPFCSTLQDLQDDLSYNTYPLVTLLALINSCSELLVLKI